MLFQKRAAPRERLDRVAKLYLAYKFFGALFFTYPIFYQFATQNITPIQVGIFFSVIGICSFAAEIPTGIIADKRGRKSSGLWGKAILAIAPLVVFFGHSFSAYLVAAACYGLGRAFLSGALESLVYDHKNVSKTAYRRINELEITCGQAGILASAACGGLLFAIHPGLPFIAEAITFLICLALIACMQEQHKAGYTKPTASYRHHFVRSVKYLFATSYLRVLVLMGTTFSVMLGMCIQFVNEAAMIEQGLQAGTRGFLIAVAGTAALIIVNLVLLRLLKSDIARVAYFAGGALIAYTFMSINVMSIFLLGYLVWHCLNATSSFIRVMLHDRIPSSHRSTIMSNFRALAVLVGLGASTATGMLVQWARTPRAAYIVFGIITCSVLVPGTAWLIVQLRKTEPGLPESTEA